MYRPIRALCQGAFVLSVLACAVTAAAEYPIAGREPQQRPEGAPVIEWVRHEKPWFEHALTGVSTPYPPSLYFLDNQGNWYTPFNRPGMAAGPYNIRGWKTIETGQPDLGRSVQP